MSKAGAPTGANKGDAGAAKAKPKPKPAAKGDAGATAKAAAPQPGPLYGWLARGGVTAGSGSGGDGADGFAAAPVAAGAMPEQPIAASAGEGDDRAAQSRSLRLQLARASIGDRSGAGGVDAKAEDRALADRSAGEPLPDGTRAEMESRFGQPLGGVRVHHDSGAAALARSLEARAFTRGSDVYFAAGRYRPESVEGRRLLGHELAHTIQQQRGGGGAQAKRDRPDSDPLEAEADRAADAVSRQSTIAIGGAANDSVPQREPEKKGKQDDTPQVSLPTSTLLRLAIKRLDVLPESAGPLAEDVRFSCQHLTEQFWKAITEPQKEGAAEEEIRLKAQTVNDYLFANGNAFAALSALYKRENYLPGIADAILDKVKETLGWYAVPLRAMVFFQARVWKEEVPKAIESAQKAMAALPDFIATQYLGPKGLEPHIKSLPGQYNELMMLRALNGGGVSKGRPIESIINWESPTGNPGSDAVNDLMRRLTAIRNARGQPGVDVGESLRFMTAKLQVISSVLNILLVDEQLAVYESKLDGLLNSAVEVFAKSVYGPVKEYRKKADAAVTAAEADAGKEALNLSTILNAHAMIVKLTSEAEFQRTMSAVEDRLKTLAIIRFAGKMIAITAVAAMGGGVVAEYAGAAALGLGASEGVAATAGFVAEVLTFTAISRQGQKMVFGNVEGSFLGDAITNALMFTALRGANKIFEAAVTKAYGEAALKTTTAALGKAATGFIALQLFAEMEHVAKGQGLMSGEERVRSLVSNTILMVALEAGRFITEPITRRLTAPALRFKFDVRFKRLAESSEALSARVDALKRGELSPDQIADLLGQLQTQWFEELKLINDAAPKVEKGKGKGKGKEKEGVISEAEAKEMIAKYQAATARIQVQLAKANVPIPKTPGGALYVPLAGGVVAFNTSSSEALDAAKKFYHERGGTFEKSRLLKGAFEARLPNGELTFFVPDNALPKNLPSAAKVAAARDAAQRASEEDPIAKSGFDKFKGAFGDRVIDEILGLLAPESVADFLRALSDAPSAGILQAQTGEFFRRMAQSPDAVRFARRWGFQVLKNLARRLDWGPELASTLADVDARASADPEGAKALLDGLAKAKNKGQIDDLLGREKPVKPKAKPVRASKRSLPVDRSSDAWDTYRKEAKRDAEDHGQTLTDEELDYRADVEMFFAQAKAGKYKRYGRKSLEKFLDAFLEIAKKSAMPQSWINAHSGKLGEALFSPGYGKPEKPFFEGKPVTGTRPTGTTIPDYEIPQKGFTEYVNLKSDVIGSGPKDKTGAYEAGKDAARRYLRTAKGKGAKGEPGYEPGEATNLPPGDRYSLDFVRDPGPATQKAMLDILFGADSPVYRVKFGDGAWHTNPHFK